MAPVNLAVFSTPCINGFSCPCVAIAPIAATEPVTGAGVIDADYRGQVKVLLFNHGEKDFEVKEGDRVAQLVLERIYTPEVVEVKELEESVRGAGGFGSTG